MDYISPSYESGQVSNPSKNTSSVTCTIYFAAVNPYSFSLVMGSGIGLRYTHDNSWTRTRTWTTTDDEGNTEHHEETVEYEWNDILQESITAKPKMSYSIAYESALNSNTYNNQIYSESNIEYVGRIAEAPEIITITRDFKAGVDITGSSTIHDPTTGKTSQCILGRRVRIIATFSGGYSSNGYTAKALNKFSNAKEGDTVNLKYNATFEDTVLYSHSTSEQYIMPGGLLVYFATSSANIDLGYEKLDDSAKMGTYPYMEPMGDNLNEPPFVGYEDTSPLNAWKIDSNNNGFPWVFGYSQTDNMGAIYLKTAEGLLPMYLYYKTKDGLIKMMLYNKTENGLIPFFIKG